FLWVGRLRLFDRLGEYQGIGKAVQRRIDRGLVEFRLVALGELLADLRKLRLRRIEGHEVDADTLVAVQLPELRPCRGVVGRHHGRARQQTNGVSLRDHQVERLADTAADGGIWV